MSKREGYRLVHEPTPADMQPFSVHTPRALARRGDVRLGQRQRQRQLPRGRHLAEEHISPRVARLLPREEHERDCVHPGCPIR
eukprot:3035758-Pleurochrysis_carterae.AAC.3